MKDQDYYRIEHLKRHSKTYEIKELAQWVETLYSDNNRTKASKVLRVAEKMQCLAN